MSGFYRFKETLTRLGLRPFPQSNTYRHAKDTARDYQNAKAAFENAMVQSNKGHWIHKPQELEHFLV